MRNSIHCSHGESEYSVSYVLIIGANSDIAKAIARKYTENGYDLYLGARTPGVLAKFANDMTIRTGRDVRCVKLDVLDYESHQAMYDALEEKPVGAISAVGYAGKQGSAQDDLTDARKVFDTNFVGVVSILNIVADDFESRGSGFIIGISSAAGERGRKSNYIYGSSKAALTTYLSGLRNRLHTENVQVLTVKPGFVATKMTAGMNLPERLTAKPEQVAADIYRAQQRGRSVIYTTWIWRWIMMAVKNIPEWIFKRMSI